MPKDPIFWKTFTNRQDLKQFKDNSLLLFALQLRYNIEDIALEASNSLTDKGNDKSADLVYIDTENKEAVIAQGYMGKDMSKPSAPSKKAADLNTAMPWLLSRKISDLPVNLRSHAKTITDKQVPNPFSLEFKNNIDPTVATAHWKSIVDSMSPLAQHLSAGLEDGFKNRKAVMAAMTEFRNLVAATKTANTKIYGNFSKLLKF